jgi:hypothetical protein
MAAILIIPYHALSISAQLLSFKRLVYEKNSNIIPNSSNRSFFRVRKILWILPPRIALRKVQVWAMKA